MSLSNLPIDDTDVLDGGIGSELLLEHGTEHSERHIVHAEVPPELGRQTLPATIK